MHLLILWLLNRGYEPSESPEPNDKILHLDVRTETEAVCSATETVVQALLGTGHIGREMPRKVSMAELARIQE